MPHKLLMEMTPLGEVIGINLQLELDEVVELDMYP